MRGFWKNFITGLLIVAPAFVTLVVFQFLFSWLFHALIDPAAGAVSMFIPREIAGWLLRMVILVLFLIVVALIGLATRVLILRRLFASGEQWLRRLPVVGNVYGMIREIASSFSLDHKKMFKHPVLLEWPNDGVYSIGFVTSSNYPPAAGSSPDLVHVYIPTVPTPAGGFLALVPADKVIPLQISVEEALKMIISCGFAGPTVSSKIVGR